jgi:hypothetical protein
MPDATKSILPNLPTVLMYQQNCDFSNDNPESSVSLDAVSRVPLHLTTAILIILVFTLLAGFNLLGWSASSMIDAACWAIIAIVVWVFWSWRRIGGSLFDPYGLFMISAFAFNGGQAILQVLGINPSGILANLFSPETTLKSLLSVAMGLIATHLGALTAASRIMQYGNDSNCKKMDYEDDNALHMIGWIMLGISIVPIVLSMSKNVAVVFQSGYFALYQQEAGIGFGSGLQILAGFFIPAILFLLGGSGSSRFSTILSLILIGLYSIITLMLGARYGGLAPLLAYAWLWDRCKRRIPRKVLALGAGIFLFIIFPLLQNTRDVPLADKALVDYYRQGVASVNMATAGLREMGGSLATVAYTLELVPSIRSYDYGLQYVYSLLTIFPNVYWAIHPTIERGTPSTWLVWQIDPGTAARGGGYGFSFIAEALLNFGFWGAPFVLFLIGLLYARFVAWALRSDDIARFTILSIYMTYFLIYARSDSTSIIRPLFWYVLFPYLIIILFRQKARIIIRTRT